MDAQQVTLFGCKETLEYNYVLFLTLKTFREHFYQLKIYHLHVCGSSTAMVFQNLVKTKKKSIKNQIGQKDHSQYLSWIMLQMTHISCTTLLKNSFKQQLRTEASQ